MEIQAVLSGSQSLKEPCEIQLYSDSQYVLKGLKEWLPGWVKKNWVNSQKKPVANADQWKLLYELVQIHKVHTHWVKGHAGHPENEFCDTEASAQAAYYAKHPQTPAEPLSV